MLDTPILSNVSTYPLASATVEKASAVNIATAPESALITTAHLDRATLSTVARQISDSAVRAEIRDTRLSFKELGALAKDIIDKIAGPHYYANRAKNDAEIPDTDDPVRLERARQATRFEHGAGHNPFAGLSQDQLRLIMYDEGGAFTINERSAAFSENHAQQEIWNKAISKRYIDEYNETGKSTETLIMIMAHYNELPPIEKAQYPANYVANLTSGDNSALQIFNSRSNRNNPDISSGGIGTQHDGQT